MAGAFNSASKLAIGGYVEEAGARTEQSTHVEFEVIPFECVRRDCYMTVRLCSM